MWLATSHQKGNEQWRAGEGNEKTSSQHERRALVSEGVQSQDHASYSRRSAQAQDHDDADQAGAREPMPDRAWNKREGEWPEDRRAQCLKGENKCKEPRDRKSGGTHYCGDFAVVLDFVGEDKFIAGMGNGNRKGRSGRKSAE